MRVKLLRNLAWMSVVGVLAAGCADPSRSVSPSEDGAPALALESTIIVADVGTQVETLRLLLQSSIVKTDFELSDLDALYTTALGIKTPERSVPPNCGVAGMLIASALDAYGFLASNKVAPPAGETWEALTQSVVDELGAACGITIPAGVIDPNAIVSYVKSTVSAELRSPDELVALKIPAGAMGGDALVVVTRDPGTAPNPTLLGTTLQQYGPVYKVATYPATTLDMTAARLELFVVGSSPTLVRAPTSAQNSLAIVLAPGSGSSSEGTTVVLRPTYCALLSGRVGQWGGAEFLKLTPTVTWGSSASDRSLGGGFGVAFLSDSASTSGSGCGQAPPAFDSDALRSDEPTTGAPGTAFFDVQAGVALAAVDANAVGTFGVVRIYDPALSSQVRAGLSAKVCASVATLTNTTGKDVLAVIDPVNRATGRWSSWKLPILVPPGGATARLPLTSGDTKAGEVQLSYGPESVAHVGLSSGCP